MGIIDSASFEQTRKTLDFLIDGLSGNADKAKSCMKIASHYRQLARTDGGREKALKELDYFLKKAKSYGWNSK